MVLPFLHPLFVVCPVHSSVDVDNVQDRERRANAKKDKSPRERKVALCLGLPVVPAVPPLLFAVVGFAFI